MEPTYYPIEPQEDGSFSINYTGTAPTPVVLKIVPRLNLQLLTIEGLTEEPLKFIPVRQSTQVNGYTQVGDEWYQGIPGEALQAGDIFIIDGEKHTFTRNDENMLVQMHHAGFPYLKPGINEIKISNLAALGVEIKYKVRYI